MLDGITTLPNVDVSYLDKLLLDHNGSLKLLPARVYQILIREHLALWCHIYGRYGVPTLELVQFLRKLIGNRTAIEIGAGYGDLSVLLNIPATDSKLQQSEELVSQFYQALRQPAIRYPGFVEKLDAADAIQKYRPKVVLASWVTQLGDEKTPQSCSWGIDEEWIINNCETYVQITHDKVAGKKRALRLPHQEYRPGWMVSRSLRPGNVIYIWEKVIEHEVGD
jgi:hypothetical protein